MGGKTLWVLSIGLVFMGQMVTGQAVKELDRLQGEWVLLETADEKRPDRGDECIRMVLSGKQVTMTFAGLITNQGFVDVSCSAKLKNIDMRFGEGPAMHGVYDLAGDVLTICLDKPGKSRPAGLIPKGTQWVETWKRSKP